MEADIALVNQSACKTYDCTYASLQEHQSQLELAVINNDANMVSALLREISEHVGLADWHYLFQLAAYEGSHDVK